MMILLIFKQWIKKPLGVILIIGGYIIGMLVLSAGISSVEFSNEYLNDKYSGNPAEYSLISVRTEEAVKGDYKKCFDALSEISKYGDVNVLNFGTVLLKKKGIAAKFTTVPVLLNSNPKWHIPIIKGEYFSKDSINRNYIVIGKSVAKKYSLNINDDVIIGNEKFIILGICGREYRQTQWDEVIYIPYNRVLDNIDDLNNRILDKKNGALNLTIVIRDSRTSSSRYMKDVFSKTFSEDNITIGYTELPDVEKSSFNNTLMISIIITSIILIINIINVVNLSLFWILDRRKQLAIMLSLGATDFAIKFWIIVEMVIMAAVSSIFALIIQKIIWIVFKDFMLKNGMFFDIHMSNFVFSILIGLICGCITAITPVRLVLKLKPAEALRYE